MSFAGPFISLQTLESCWHRFEIKFWWYCTQKLIITPVQQRRKLSEEVSKVTLESLPSKNTAPFTKSMEV